MTELRKAAEMALKYFEDAHGLEDEEVAIKEALRQALAQPDSLPLRKKSFNEDVGRLLSTGKGFYGDGTPIDPDEIQMKIQGVGDEVFVCTEVHLPRPPQREWVGLTDDEIKEIVGPWGDTPIKGYTRKLFDQIEAKLREKNQ